MKSRETLLQLLRGDSEIREEIKKIVIEETEQNATNALMEQEIDNSDHSVQNGKLQYALEEIKNRDGEISSLKFDVTEKENKILKLLKREKEHKDEINNLIIENQHLKKEIENLTNKNQLLHNNIDEIKTENKKLANELENVSKYAKELKTNYSVLDEKYRLYLQLGDNIQRKLQRVLSPDGEKAQKAEIFLGYGVQEDNIAVLWDVIAANFKELEEVNKLNDMINIFNYLFNICKAVSFKNISYEMPEIGDEFDERRHSRTSGSSAIGNIEQVILPGFKIGNNIQKKALVCVK